MEILQPFSEDLFRRLSFAVSSQSMRPALRSQAFICLDCRVYLSRNFRKRFQSSVPEAQNASPQAVDLSASFPLAIQENTTLSPRTKPPEKRITQSKLLRTPRTSKTALPASQISPAESRALTRSQDKIKSINSEGHGAISIPDRAYLKAIRLLRKRLEEGIASLGPSITAAKPLLFEDAVNSIDVSAVQGLQRDVLTAFQKLFAGQHVSAVLEETTSSDGHPDVQRKLLDRLRIGRNWKQHIGAPLEGTLSSRPHSGAQQDSGGVGTRLRTDTDENPPEFPFPSAIHLAISDTKYDEPARSAREPKEGKNSNRSVPQLDSSKVQILLDTEVGLKPLMIDTPKVRGLSSDLSRVLFNPGVYQLQDPRSRVYNFSPYLQRILPVSEFNFDALNEYITSSKDTSLRKLGREHGKKYIGSSSSMTAILTHFHFLLSAWRPINVKTLSQSFTDPLRSFTQYQRGPSAIFLRLKDGVYAVDADKEYDSANILMSLGKSMEKLLTLEEDEFELYRKSGQEQGTLPPTPEPEVYHYTESGDFLLRSQLDAYDSRLPGTGTFDLKTRAVVSIRMNVQDHESGMGYEIQNRFGDMESYEKEYFDMIRSAFLKYSLQVRMGRMDGIFVAYHNIERIFGFQYISLPEIDSHLHGTEKPAIGDTEFKLSLALLNKIFDKATSKLPDTSLRFHFETRDSMAEGGSFMYIFAEAQSEEDIENIQNTKQAEIAEFEARILSTPKHDANLLKNPAEDESEFVLDDATIEEMVGVSDLQNEATIKIETTSKNDAFPQPEAGKLVAFTLRARNKVNGQLEIRPVDLNRNDSWDVEYTLEEMSEKQALSTYSQCRGRRARLQRSTQREDAAADYYLRKIQSLAQKGRGVRRSMDRKDAGRPIIVL